MSERKTLDKEFESDRQVMILHNRRKDEVKKNFAIGIQRVVAVKHSAREHSLKKSGEKN
jgi:hypothetical protein